MKKYLVLLLGALFVLGFAATSFAIHAEIPSGTQAVVAKGTTQVTIGGELRIRGEFRDNIRDFNSDLVDRDAYYETRVRVSLDAQVTPNTRGFIQLESGNSNTVDNVTWGGSDGAKGGFTKGNAKIGDMTILQAWILHTGSGLLGTPALVKVGHMPIKLGNGLFFDHTKFGDDAILLGADPTKDIHIILHTIKFDEGDVAAASSIVPSAALNDDATAYGVIFAYDIDKKSSISADVTYVDQQNSGHTGASGQGERADINLWNFGLRGATEISGFGIMVDVEFQTGELGDAAVSTLGAANSKFKGYAAMAGISYKIDPVKLSLDFAYGSGDDDTTDTKIKTFITTLGADQHYTYVYEYRTVNAAGQANGGLANTTYIKLGADANLTKDIAANLGLYFLKAVKKVAVDTDSTATSTNTTSGTSKSIGTEIDAKVSYKIDKNLIYWVEGGYLFAGDFWKTATKDPDGAYAIRHGIQLNF